MTVYRQSSIVYVVEEHLFIDRRQLYLYGDTAYMLRLWLQIGFSMAFETYTERLHNISMSSIREAVEWS